MEYILKFKVFLSSLKPAPSKVTVKNYALDVKHFIDWFEKTQHQSFHPSYVTKDHIEAFHKDTTGGLSIRSLDRHISSLRKFFHAMKLEGIIASNPFDSAPLQQVNTDPFKLKQFKDFLYVYNASNLTIKNYIIDLKQFFSWAIQTLSQTDSTFEEEQVLSHVTPEFLATYRQQLIDKGVFSSSSINRKLSSLRKYIAWAEGQNLLENQNGFTVNPNDMSNIISARKSAMPITNLASELSVGDDGRETEERNTKQNSAIASEPRYSHFPPFRLAQKITKGINLALDGLVITPLAILITQGHKAIWTIKGKPLFISSKANLISALQGTRSVKSLYKTFYNPFTGSPIAPTWYDKLWFHARHTRPNWYRRYHSMAVAHYFNWAILAIVITIVGFGFYNAFVQKPQSGKPLLAAAQPNRILSFQGRLTDNNNNPITTATNLRFGIYTDQTSTGSALLWQEVDNITPDGNGVFSVLLGKNSGIQQSLFANNANLYLGVTVEATSELTPRQQLATVAYATNAETLQGLPPITQSGAGTSNVVLALNSAGNLSIGAASTFQTVGGTFTLAGDALVLNTNSGTNGNITVAPDGQGFIDLQKALVNTTQNNNIPSAAGSVEVDDTFAILATNSGVPALTINQNGVGTLIAASVSGSSVFTVANSGAISDSNYTTSGGVLYTDGSGLFLQTSAGSGGQCLTSSGGGAPTWGSCGSGGSGTNFWTLVNGTLYPVNTTLDLLIGGTATNGANFAFINNTPGSGTPTASISGNITLNAAGQIQTTNNQNLTLGGNSTGNIILSPNNGSGTVTVNATTISTSGSIIPTSTSVNLGSPANYFGNAYITNLFSSPNTQYFGFWQLNSGVLSPIAIKNDLAIGGTATNSAKFQVFGTTGNATTAGSLTFDGSGSLIQTTNNQGLIIGGNTTGNITLSPLNGTGTVTIAGLGTGVVHSTGGVLSSSFVNLATDVTGVLPIANGGTNTNTIGAAGSVAYSNGTNYAFTAVGSTNQCLISNGSGAPSWSSCSSAAGANNWWNLDSGSGILYPINATLDVLFGGSASSSANFAFLNNAPGSGTPTASISGNLTLNSAGQIQTTKNQALTIGGNSTGNIILSPLNGNGNVTINGTALNTTKTSFDLLNTTATTINFGGAATSVNIGNSGGSTTVNGALVVSGATNLNGNTTIGDSNSDTVFFNSRVNSSIIPNAADTYDLGASGLEWNNLYVKNIITGGNIAGFWQRFAGVLSPLNISDDLVVGGTSTSTAKFQIFGNTGNATTAGTLTFNTNGQIQTTSNTPLTLGGASTGNIILSPNNGTGIVTLNGFVGSNLLPSKNLTYDLGSTSLQWNNVYAGSIFSNGQQLTQLFQRNSGVISPLNITDDLAIGGTATNTAKFQVFGNTGNATTAGNLTFNTNGQIQTTSNQSLTLGGNSTGNIILSPNNGTGSVTVNGTFNSNLIPTTTNTYDLGSAGLEWNNLYVNNIISGGTIAGFFQRNNGVISPLNISDDLALGGTATNGAKFQIFGTTGNATTTGTLTFNGTGSLIQTTNNQGLTIGGDTTGNITLSPLNGSGTVTINGLGTGVVHSTNGLLSSSAVNLASGDVTGVLPIANGGTNTNTIGAAGSVAYSNGTNYAFTAVGSTGNCLVSNGSGAPTWLSCASAANDNYWTLNGGLGVLYPKNTTLDVLFGGTSSTSANFAFLNNTPGSGTPTASISGNLTLNSAGQIQTTNNQSLTVGGNSTGNIILSPNNGTGILSLNAPTIGTNQTAVNLLNTTATTINFAGAATTLNIGNAGGSAVFNGGVNVTADTSLNGNVLLGDANSDNITFNGQVHSDILPAITDTYNLGSAAFEWNNLYVKNIITSGSTAGFWQRVLGVLSPANTTDDLAIGGTSTNSAKFQIFANTGNATTAGNFVFAGSNTSNLIAARNNAGLTIGDSQTGNIILNGGNVGIGTTNPGAKLDVNGSATISGNLTLNSAAAIQTTNNQSLTLGGNATGNIILSPNNGNGIITINGKFNSNLLPQTTDTYDLGAANLEWNNLYVKNIISGGNIAGFWQRNTGVVSPTNISDDLAIGSTATNGAKFQVFGTTGNATTTGTLTFTNGGSQIQTTSNQPLTLGGNSTGGITLSPNNGSGIVSVNGLALQTTASVFNAFTTNATTLNLGVTGGTTTVNSALTVSGTLTANGNSVLGATSANTINPVGVFSGSLIPQSTSINLGAPSAYYGNAYITNLFPSANSQYLGFWQLNSGVLSPTNITNDIAVGSTATTGAKFQVFANTGNATTAGTLTFTSNNNQIQTTSNQPLVLGGNTTGNIQLSPNNGTGSITINGSFNSNLLPTTTDTYDLGSLAQEWNTIYVRNIVSSGNLAGFWQRNAGTLSPVNITDDILAGGTATVSAKFAVLNMTGSGTPTASVSSGISGIGAYFDAAGNFQTVRNAGLTLGGNSTGNIILKPLNGSGTVTIAGVALNTTSNAFDLLNTTATSINFAGAATTLNIGNSGGTTTINGALAVSGNTNLNGNTTIGDATSDTVAFTARVNSNILPDSDVTRDLGNGGLRWNNVYAGNLILPVSGGTGGYWTLASSVLRPTNSWNDLAVGGTSTASAKFQIFANTGNATTTGNLTFNGNGQIQTTSNQTLTFGGNSTGNIAFNSNVASNILPYLTNTYDLGSLTLQWNNGYFNNIYQNGQPITQLFQRNSGVISPLNIADDLAIGGTATNTAKFQVFGNTGNATTTGTLTFAGTPTTNVIAARNNAGLTIGDSQTGNIILNGGKVGIGTTNPGATLDVNGIIYGTQFKDRDDINYFIDPASSGTAGTFNGSIGIGTTNPSSFKLQVAGNIGPDADNTYDLGSNALRWRNIYVAGNYDGFWQRYNGALIPTNLTDDLLLGGTSTSAAKFAFINNTGAGSPTASISGNLSVVVPAGSTPAETINVLNGGSLNIQHSAGGDAGLATSLFVDKSGKVGIGTTNPAVALNVAGTTGEVARFGSGAVTDSNYISIGSAARAIFGYNATTSDVVIQGISGKGIEFNPNNDTFGNGTTAKITTTGFFGIGTTLIGNGQLVVNQTNTSGLGDIFTASASGSTKFTIQNDGTLIAKKYTAADGLLYLSDTTGTVAETGQGASHTVLHGNGASAPTFSVVDLTADVGSTILPLANGGTNNNLTADNGGIVYSDASKLQILASTATAGQCLVSGSHAAPTWGTCAGGGTNWWTMSGGALFPINTTLDLFLGGSATTSAKFAVLNMTGSGTPTASVSSGLNGSGTFITADGTLQTTNNQGLTIGGTSTGNITLSPLNSGNGSTINLNAKTIDDNQSTINVLNTPTNITLGTAATTFSLGKTGGTTTVNSALNVTGDISANSGTLTTSQTTFNLLSSTATTINFGAGATTALNIGASNTPINVKGDVTLGTSSTNNINANGSLNTDLVPTGNGSINLGSPTHYYNTVYANTFVSPVSGGVSGFWQLTNSVLSPVNSWNDLAVGGNATGSATPFQVFATTVGVNTAGTATTSGNLTFRGSPTQSLTSKINLLNGASLGFYPSVGGDSNTSVFTIANNGTLTATGTLNLNSGVLATNQTTASLFDSANTINIGTSGTGGAINLGNSTSNNTIHGNTALGDSSSNTINPIGHFSNSLIPDTDNNRSLGSLALRWKDLFLSGAVTASNVYLPVTGGTDGYWTLASNVLSPTNNWNDLAIGGTATSTAKFQVFSGPRNGDPAGTASTSGYLTFSQNSAPRIQTTDMLPLLIGGSTTGSVQLSPKGTTGLFVNGTGLVGVGTNTPTFSLAVSGSDSSANNSLGTIALSNTAAGGGNWYIRAGATGTNTPAGGLSIANDANYYFNLSSIGKAGFGTLTTGNGQLVVNQTNNSGLGDVFSASASGTTLFTIANDGTLKNGLIPNAADTYNLGSVSKEWDTLYVRQIVTPSSGGLAGFWQLSNAGVLAPANLSNDVAIAGSATSSAVFQVFANAFNNGTTVTAGTATTSGNLVFRGNNSRVNLLNNTSLGFYNSVGGDSGLGANPSLFLANSGSVGIGTANPSGNLYITDSAIGGTQLKLANTDTGGHIYKFISTGSGNSVGAGFLTISDETTNATRLAISPIGSTGIGVSTSALGNAQLVVNQTNTSGLGDIFTASASGTTKFTVTSDGNVGIGNLNDATILGKSGLHVEKNSLGNALTLFNQLSPVADIITASSSGTTQFKLTNAGILQGRSFQDLDNTNYFIDPAASGIAGTFNGNVSLGTITTDATTSAELTVAGNLQAGALDGTTWGQTPYKYRSKIVIVGNGTSLTNYQVQLSVNTQAMIDAGKMQSSCADMRFTDSDGTTMLNYWIESGCNTPNTTVWVKVPSIASSGNSNIYMYYGNSGASDNSNGSGTFTFFDDFNTLDTTNTWTATGATSVSSSQLTITTGAVYSKNSVTAQPGFIEEGKVKFTNGTTTLAGINMSSSNFINSGNTPTKTSNMILDATSSNNNVNFFSGTGATTTFNNADTRNEFDWTSGQWETLGIAVDSSHVYDYRNRSKLNSWGSGYTTASNFAILGNFLGSNAGTTNGTDTTWDWIIVRQFQATPPTNYIAGEQDRSQTQSLLYANGTMSGVGIGTANPLATLDIVGTNATGLLVENGNVGIGTTSATRTLDVNGTWGGNFIDREIDSNNTETYEEPRSGLYYNLQWTFPSAASNHTGTINLTGLPNVAGTIAVIRGRVDASGSGGTQTLQVNINGSQVFSVNAGGGGANKRHAIVGYNGAWNGGSWVILSDHINSYDCNCDTFDLAETMPYTGEEPKNGQLLTTSVDGKAINTQITTNEYDQKTIGVVSTMPHELYGADENGLPYPGQTKLTLDGRIPVMVTSLDGPILEGDGIVSSPLPGIGMKPSRGSQIVAKALEPFNPTYANASAAASLDAIIWPEDLGDNADHPVFKVPVSSLDSQTQALLEREYSLAPTDYFYVGKVMAASGNGYYEPNAALATTVDLQLQDASTSSGFTTPHYFTLRDSSGNPLTAMGGFLELVAANFRAGGIQTQQLFTNSLAIATSNVTIAGVTLHDYVANIVNEVLQNNGSNVNSPIASINQLHAGVISPLGNDDSIALSLNNSRLEVKNGASGSAVATIDNVGNATFSGTLNSQNLAVNSDATISGTLHAGKIVANDIEGLNAIVGTLSAQNITNVTNIYFATPSGTPTNGNIATGPTGSSSANFGVPGSPSLGGPNPYLGYANIASYSGFLAYVPNLNADTAMFNQGLISLGATSLSDTTITGQLSIGTNFILANNSINVLGQSFEVQPLRQGGVNFEGGLLAIDTDGNLTVNGNAIFAKNLSANIISPLSNDRNLTVKLGENPTATGSALATSTFAVQNASGSGVFAINQLGDIAASGAATFGKLNFSLVEPALAVSNTEVIATGSAGTAAVKAHQVEITIDNKNVTNRSLIYITPVGQSATTPYLLRQVNGTSFTVGIPAGQYTDTTFNWLIVN